MLKYLSAGVGVVFLLGCFYSCGMIPGLEEIKVTGSCESKVKMGTSSTTFTACVEYKDIKEKEEGEQKKRCEKGDEHTDGAGTWSDDGCKTEGQTAQCELEEDGGTQTIFIYDATLNSILKESAEGGDGMCPKGSKYKELKAASAEETYAIAVTMSVGDNKYECGDFGGLTDTTYGVLKESLDSMASSNDSISITYSEKDEKCDQTGAKYQCTGKSNSMSDSITEDSYGYMDPDSEKEGKCTEDGGTYKEL